ncbi:PadR family transcriptional regulator [Paenibacillus flagellatus]|uniref:Transcription regulator PadR N-terminal domain-containing protein n=1 Tax=Paenibacillus flagellatus TaxID=2211139 RepID=A0A2V5K025_9BACL|nr:PadR family transcriptional regulator [Paenibacillus flagellatus]PYI52519.1 hypothetical protein DLM86_20295 [Paenibacillus flagellatus]
MRTNKSYYALLGLLAFGPHSGYDVKRRIEQQLSHFWSESYGQIYPNLKKLVEEGLATTNVLVMGLMYQATKSLYLSIGFHFAWDFYSKLMGEGDTPGLLVYSVRTDSLNDKTALVCLPLLAALAIVVGWIGSRARSRSRSA